jgi:flagellar biosynthesis protein FlhA
MTYIALLGSGTPNTPDGLILDIAYRSLNGYSLLTMIFAFLSLAVLNMMITSRGISRATEVTARFYLDSVPGRQMSVDADLASGAINYETANQRRANINLKSSQYSMLDGISKFMVGESTTSSLVLLLSIVFFLPSLRENSEGVSEICLILSIGIIWQILQFLSALCYSYLLMAISKESVDNSSTKRHLDWTIGAVILIGVVLPLLDRGHYLYLSVIFLAAVIGKRYFHLTERIIPKENLTKVEEKFIKANVIAPVTIEIDPIYATKLGSEGQNLVNLVRHLRDSIEQDLGFKFPFVSIIDNISLQEGEYNINIRGVRLARGKQMLSALLAVPGGGAITLNYAQPALDPVFNIPAFWIEPTEAAKAIKGGYTLTDNAGVILTHLAKTIRDNSHKMLSPQETQRLIKNSPSAKQLSEVDNSLNELPLSTVHSTFVRLLEEGFSLTNMPYILNLLVEATQLSLRRVEEVTAYLRHALAIEYLTGLTEKFGEIAAITLEPNTTRVLEEIFTSAENDHQFTAKKEKMTSVFDLIHEKSRCLAIDNGVLIAKATLRANLATALRLYNIPLFVASFDEIGVNSSINIAGTV